MVKAIKWLKSSVVVDAVLQLAPNPNIPTKSPPIMEAIWLCSKSCGASS